MIAKTFRPIAAGAAIAGQFLAPAALAKDDVLTLEPIDPWVLDYADDSCALRRTFGSTEKPVYLEMKQFAPGDQIQFTVATKAAKISRALPSVTYGADAVGREAKSASFAEFAGSTPGVVFDDTLRTPETKRRLDQLGPTNGEQRVSILNWSDAERDERETRIDAIAIEAAFDQTLALRTGELHVPMEAMRACLDELLTHWGLDAEANRHLRQTPVPRDQMAWAIRAQQAYPSSAIREGRDASLVLRLIVSPEGRVTDCATPSLMGDKVFSEAACSAALRNARFEPALAAAGAPIASYYTTTLVYTAN